MSGLNDTAAYAGWINDNEVRLKSSSGGDFFSILLLCYSSGRSCLWRY